jgi:hypothetical protein
LIALILLFGQFYYYFIIILALCGRKILHLLIFGLDIFTIGDVVETGFKYGQSELNLTCSLPDDNVSWYVLWLFFQILNMKNDVIVLFLGIKMALNWKKRKR